MGAFFVENGRRTWYLTDILNNCKKSVVLADDGLTDDKAANQPFGRVERGKFR